MEKSGEAGSSTARGRHTAMRDVAWQVGLRYSASHSRWRKSDLDLDSALLRHVVFPSGGQVLSWDVCAAKEAPKTALSALIRVWEWGSC